MIFDIRGNENRLSQIVQAQNALERPIMRDIVAGCCQLSIKPGEVQYFESICGDDDIPF
ncbi:MAG: hypothetical protein ABSF52_18545 [Syntrophobacteraceae bacterium]|jgi:hypothetical protein